MRNFYPDLDEAVQIAEKELESVKIEDEVTDVVCEECGTEHGYQVWSSWKIPGMSRIPGMSEIPSRICEKIGVACPKCGKDVVIRKTKKGQNVLWV